MVVSVRDVDQSAVRMDTEAARFVQLSVCSVASIAASNLVAEQRGTRLRLDVDEFNLRPRRQNQQTFHIALFFFFFSFANLFITLLLFLVFHTVLSVTVCSNS